MLKDKSYYLNKFDALRKERCQDGTMFQYYAAQLMDCFADVVKEMIADYQPPPPPPELRPLKYSDISIGTKLLYKHGVGKGTIYTIVSLPVNMDPVSHDYGVTYVCYKHDNSDDIWVRPIDNFIEVFVLP